MKYQLVLQFDASNIEDFDQLIEIEDSLERALGNCHEVDGHDFGSGEANIFILTDDPKTAFYLAKDKLEDSVIARLKVAYRELTGEEYKVIWPKHLDGEFNIV